MLKINRAKFYNNYPFRPLSKSQFFAIDFILDKLDESELILRLTEYAYVLATIKHETAESYQPIKEMGGDRYLRSKSYFPFFGRGIIQLTWKFNYQNFSDILGIDLIHNLDLALEPETAWRICEYGMAKGTFTGKKLSDYFNDKGTDFVRARRIINGNDRAGLISGYAISFYQTLEFE